LRRQRPEAFDSILLKALNAPGEGLEWIYPTGRTGEREPQGIAFLRDRPDVLALWKKLWPQRGRQQTWDGVAQLHTTAESEWVLMEAKANAVEFVTPPCQASKEGGRKTIEAALNRVKASLGVHRHLLLIRFRGHQIGRTMRQGVHDGSTTAAHVQP